MAIWGIFLLKKIASKCGNIFIVAKKRGKKIQQDVIESHLKDKDISPQVCAIRIRNKIHFTRDHRCWSHVVTITIMTLTHEENNKEDKWQMVFRAHDFHLLKWTFHFNSKQFLFCTINKTRDFNFHNTPFRLRTLKSHHDLFINSQFSLLMYSFPSHQKLMCHFNMLFFSFIRLLFPFLMNLIEIDHMLIMDANVHNSQHLRVTNAMQNYCTAICGKTASFLLPKENKKHKC